MKKVGIVTIQSQNLGNRLQNYALQEVILGLGYDSETIRRDRSFLEKKRVFARIKAFLRRCVGSRSYRFSQFDKRIRFSRGYACGNLTSDGLNEEYDCFVAGSDQVWNPYYSFVGSADFLLFASPEKRVSYAASFGVDSIPADQKEFYKDSLAGFRRISVREESAVEIIEELAGKKADLVLDPTLLLGAEKWRSVSRKPFCLPKNRYLLVYSLGQRSEIFEKDILTISKNNHLDVLDLLSKNRFGRALAVGPAEFIYLVEHSSIVMTDSFHATVFSLIFHKPVRTYERAGIDMGSRIRTIAKITGYSNAFTSDGTFIIEKEDDFDLIDKRLQGEREKSIHSLSEAICSTVMCS